MISKLQIKYDKIFLLTDTNVDKIVLPTFPFFAKFPKMVIPAGEESKNLANVEKIWDFLIENNCTRNSVLLNVGGGMVSDIGGFAAATFKRGIDFINYPTTLLSAVDAAIGGKTGINFRNYKNNIGVFAFPKDVVINIDIFKTLSIRDLYAGYAEMLKYGFITGKTLLNDIYKFDLQHIDTNLLEKLILECKKIKENFVEIDTFDRKERMALNFGHTFGHSFESLLMDTPNPLLHGEAVAWGMVAELLLSHHKLNFPKDEVLKLHAFVKENYPALNISCKDSGKIYQILCHDKKNFSSSIIFTLLYETGKPVINQEVSQKEILDVLDFLC